MPYIILCIKQVIHQFSIIYIQKKKKDLTNVSLLNLKQNPSEEHITYVKPANYHNISLSASKKFYFFPPNIPR